MRFVRAARPAGASIIVLDHVSKAYGSKRVLDDVSLSVKRGEVLVILGGSGTGKSVSLRHMNGLERPDAGEVWVDGVEVASLPEEELTPVRKKVGMLFQSGALFDSMTVFENIAFALREHTTWSEEQISAARRGGARFRQPRARRRAPAPLLAFGWNEETRLSGPNRRAQARGPSLRRAHDGTRPRDVDDDQPPHRRPERAARDDVRRRDPRHRLGAASSPIASLFSRMPGSRSSGRPKKRRRRTSPTSAPSSPRASLRN